MHSGMAALRIGCSGWNYRHWRGTFYPSALPPARWFEHYARHFDTVEVNNTFYQLPDEDVFDAWDRQAPAGFVYAIKASRFLTHMKKLKDPAEPVARILGRARRLGAHLGPVLYQLPPGWKCNAPRLRALLELLPRDLTHVLEFRDPSWYTDDALAALAEHGAGLCVHDMPGSAPQRLALGKAVYVRFHGVNGTYAGAYPEAALRAWAAWLAEQRAAGRDVYAYFNNDIGTHAVRDAARLRAMLG